jgi:hypothetical protein
MSDGFAIHATQMCIGKTGAHMLPLEDIIARHKEGLPLTLVEINAVVASWRERGELLKECADDLEAEFRHRYELNDGTIHPAQQIDFDNAMDLVDRARAALKDKP